MRKATIDKAPLPGTARDTKIKIEKNIPVPPITRNRDDRFPWLDMEPNDSFFVSRAFEDDDVNEENFIKRMQARAQNASKKHNTKFVVRRAVQGSITGVRVWRVEAKHATNGGRH